jgi:hypothetical protein
VLTHLRVFKYVCLGAPCTRTCSCITGDRRVQEFFAGFPRNHPGCRLTTRGNGPSDLPNGIGQAPIACRRPSVSRISGHLAGTARAEWASQSSPAGLSRSRNTVRSIQKPQLMHRQAPSLQCASISMHATGSQTRQPEQRRQGARLELSDQSSHHPHVKRFTGLLAGKMLLRKKIRLADPERA